MLKIILFVTKVNFGDNYTSSRNISCIYILYGRYGVRFMKIYNYKFLVSACVVSFLAGGLASAIYFPGRDGKLEELSKKTKEQIEEFCESTKNEEEKSMNQAIEKKFQDAKKSGEDAARSVDQTIKDKANELKERSKDAAEDAEDAAKSAGQTIKDKAHELKERSKEAIEDAKDAAKSVGEKIKDKAHEIKEKSKDMIR